MGKHKNPITVSFLGLLRERGNMYNFSVEEEYPLIKGIFYADIVYILPSDNKPVVSFEVESTPTSYVSKNATKYFATNSTEVPKPWQHFVIILKGTLNPSDRKSLESVTEKHNVHIFENILVDKEEHKRFDDKLEEISKAFKQIEESKNIVTEFRIGFSTKIKQCIALIEQGKENESNDAIDELIMLFKERIEKWDVPSVRFAARELFEELYKYSSQEKMCEIYQVFKDLFRFAYTQRKQLIGAMIAPFFSILFEAWIQGYDVEKGEQACKVMLGLGVDFLETDVSISEDCIHAIDNLAGDMFEPEIFSKEILFCSVAYQKSQVNSELQDFVEQYSDWIRINEEYSWDDGIKSYLKDSIEYAEGEQCEYDIDIKSYKDSILIPIINGVIDSQIEEYTHFLQEVLSESGKGEDTSFEAEDLSKMILAYEFYRPKFAFEVRERIFETDKKNIIAFFTKIVNSSNFLKKIYAGTDMITTFDELINFLEKGTDKENLGIGVSEVYSIAIINFRKKLDPIQKRELEERMRKDGLNEALDIDDKSITFEVDSLVTQKGAFTIEKLVQLLKDINSKNKISSFSTGITFSLRDI
jgi:hypothetical protein